MFKLKNLHKDWYEDGIEYGQQSWRLDVNYEVQIQLFAVPVNWSYLEDDFCGPNDEYFALRLGVERDKREKISRSEDVRVHYAYQSYMLDDATAELLLSMDIDAAYLFLRDKIDEVMAMPNDKRYCDDSSSRRLP